MTQSRKNGFTLVELLVVIVIIGVLASVTAVMAPKIRKKSQQAKAVGNMRQISSVLAGYAAEHSNKLPPINVPATENAELGVESYWHILCQYELSGGDMQRYFEDRWWQTNDSILVYPGWTGKKLNHQSVGYGMNSKLAENIAANTEQPISPEEALTVSVSLASLGDPALSPIVMPNWKYYYTCDSGESEHRKWEDFTVDDKVPVLFVDGHVETMTTREYVNRQLDTMPRP